MNPDKEYNISIFNYLISSLRNPVNETEKVHFYKIKFDVFKYKTYDCEIRVINENCIKTCLRVNKKYCKEVIGLLNMSSVSKLGGGVVKGARAQEEEIFRSTDIYSKITEIHYPIKKDELLFTPNVKIIQCRSSNNYKSFINVRNEKCNVNLISIPAIRKPNVILDEDGYEVYENDDDREIMKEKIEAMLQIFIKSECKHLVLGALGCGVYKNPVDEVVNIYKDLLKDYSKFFKSITFSILCPEGEDTSLFDSFNENFNILM